MSNSEASARRQISARKTHELVFDFIATGFIRDPHIPTVRGWIMDELKQRNPAAYDAWMDCDDPTDESLLQYFHC